MAPFPARKKQSLVWEVTGSRGSHLGSGESLCGLAPILLAAEDLRVALGGPGVLVTQGQDKAGELCWRSLGKGECG